MQTTFSDIPFSFVLQIKNKYVFEYNNMSKFNKFV